MLAAPGSRSFLGGLAVVMMFSVLDATPCDASTTVPTLTRTDVEKLVKILPQLARRSRQLRADPAVALRFAGGGGMARLPTEDVEQVEQLLADHGYTFPQFLSRLTALVATYVALQPAALDEQLPTEESPEIRRLLTDPDVSDERKAALREQIGAAQADKERLRQQMATSFVTEANKRAVRPLLRKVRDALQAAKKEAEK